MRQGLGILSLIFALMFSGVSMAHDYPSSGEVKVEEGEAFEISLSEVINPFAVWKCAKYDPQYIELLGEEYKAPPEGLAGATTHIFKFKALRAGKTDIVFETEDKKESKLYEIHIQKRPLLSRLCGWMYSEPELVTKSEPLDFTMDIHTITNTIEAYSWEDLREMAPQQEFFLENNGDSTIQITGVCMKHRPLSVTPSPYMGNSEPYTITWAVTNSTVEPGGTTSLWMDMKFNCSGKIEITDVEVYYLYKGKRHTATMDMSRWIIDVVVKDEPGLEISVEENT